MQDQASGLSRRLNHFKSSESQVEWLCELFFLDKRLDSERIAEILDGDSNITYLDLRSGQKDELQSILGNSEKMDVNDCIVYYPWRQQLVHILNRDDYRRVRLNRNRGLISVAEQKKYSEFAIGIAGLNVGSAGGMAIALEGGGRMFKLADFDHLSTSNLNRFSSSLCNVGLEKSVILSRAILEIDPYYDIQVYRDGITEELIDKFLSEPKIDLLIEEMDDLQMKIKLRLRARELGIPVLMVTGNGENVIIDIERYDLDRELPLLSGSVSESYITSVNEMEPGKIDSDLYMQMCRDFIGDKLLTRQIKDAFDRLGKDISGIPQIAECTFLRGAVIAFFTRMIATGKSVPSGRYEVRLDNILHGESI